MSKRTPPVLMAFGVLILVAVLAIIFIHPVSRYQSVRCREQLKTLGYAVQVYQGDHGHLPRQLSILSNELINPALLVCPGSGHTPGSFTNADSWTDFTFIDWSAVLGTNAVPGDYPIAYDRSISSHGGRGVNVLTVGGFVRWDANTKWLRKFVSEHPKAKLAMPE